MQIAEDAYGNGFYMKWMFPFDNQMRVADRTAPPSDMKIEASEHFDEVVEEDSFKFCFSSLHNTARFRPLKAAKFLRLMRCFFESGRKSSSKRDDLP